MLTFTIKRNWFEMIASGEKKEEYRAANGYYDSRLMKYKKRTYMGCAEKRLSERFGHVILPGCSCP